MSKASDEKNPKIIQFIHGLSDGGAENVVKNYAISMKAEGYDIEVLTLYNYPDSVTEQIVLEAGVPIKRIWGEASHKLLKRIKRRLFGRCIAYYKIKKIIVTCSPDIIHVHLPLMRYLYPVRKYLEGVKLVYTVHSIPQAFFHTTVRKNREDEKCLRWFLEHQNVQMIALTSEMAEEINQIFQISTTKVLKNPIDVNRFKNPIIKKSEMRRLLGIPQDAYVIGHVGRFSVVKNHRFLLEVFAKCLKNNRRAFLLLVGDGSLYEDIRSQLKLLKIENRTLILSHREDVAEILAAMDVFVFPSLYEGIGIALLEAQAAGLPCVISDTIPEEAIVTDNVQSIGLDESTEKWTKAVLNSIKAEGKRENTLDDYDIKNVIKCLKEIYEIKNR